MIFRLHVAWMLFVSYQGFSQNGWEIIRTDITDGIHDIEFVNDTCGFLYTYGTGTIFRTSNGGMSWFKNFQSDSLYFEQMQFFSSGLGWICGEGGKFLRTTNCGLSWSDLSLRSDEGKLLLYGMYFMNDTIGYLSGATVINRKMAPILFKTLNGGTTWTRVYKDLLSRLTHIPHVRAIHIPHPG